MTEDSARANSRRDGTGKTSGISRRLRARKSDKEPIRASPCRPAATLNAPRQTGRAHESRALRPQILDIPTIRCISVNQAGVSSRKSVVAALLGYGTYATDTYGTDDMKIKRPPAEDIVPVCSFDTLRRPLHDDEVKALYGHEFKVPLPDPSGSSSSHQFEEEYLKQLIYLLIWKRMEREMLDKYSGSISKFVQQLDSYTSSFDNVFE